METLRNAVIMSAKADYLASYCALAKICRKPLPVQSRKRALSRYVRLLGHLAMMEEVERFFRSPWFNAICTLDGTSIARHIRREAVQKHGRINWKKLYERMQEAWEDAYNIDGLDIKATCQIISKQVDMVSPSWVQNVINN